MELKEEPLIRSETGNGGTHLLSGLANRLIDQGQQIACLSCEGLVRIYNGDRIEFEDYLSSCSYWLVDQIDYFTGKPDIFSWYSKLAKEFMQRDGKIVCSAYMDMTDHFIGSYLETNQVTELCTVFLRLAF
ncbi:MAG: hypothetical protein IPO49_09880 [Bacteroidetes bacterium]|nr:hypothetical protein [Bacteroidota bacterium]